VTSIDLTPVYAALISLFAGAITILGGLAIQKLAALLKLKKDDQAIQVINTALERGVALGQVKAAAIAKEDLPQSVDTHSLALGIAGNYVAAHAADELKTMGVTPQSVADKVLAVSHLAAQAADPSSAAKPAPTPAQVAAAAPLAASIQSPTPAVGSREAIVLGK